MVHLLEIDLIMTQFPTRFINRRKMREVLTGMQSYVDRKATAQKEANPVCKGLLGPPNL